MKRVLTKRDQTKDWMSDLPYLKARLVDLHLPVLPGTDPAATRLRLRSRETVRLIFEARVAELEAQAKTQ